VRVIFARISWMTFYKGSPDDIPRGQMAYVAERRGPVAERFNFRPIGNSVYGYVTQTHGTPYHLERIDSAAHDAEQLDGVLVVFVAARPSELGSGQFVVGWYRRARLYRDYRYAPRAASRQGSPYCCEAAVRDAFLLPTRRRTWRIPTGRGGMGQAKVRYFDPRQAWMRKILAQVAEFSGPSLVAEPEAEVEAIAAAAGESGHAGGQGFAVDARICRLVEERAVAVAKRTYSAAGYDVRVVGQPFDLYCRRKAASEKDVWVEVKGTQGTADQVILTHGEVKFYARRYPRTELFVVNSIRVENGTARGGKWVRYRRWRAAETLLTPITYWYRLPTRNS
jgi:uncharacterized protein DUF3883